MPEGIWGRETSAFSQKVLFVKKFVSHTLNAIRIKGLRAFRR